ncbi:MULTISPECIES: DedA family protein [unclassified Streptomyces]|uniref:DedA family protein n=1 Tax=unclassified Streptomyces TaxID=2593676 RepID=UPI00202E484E|nr:MULTISPECIES: VTT domain-containing protein [unclassified Streptomyces]MCM1965624.1 VTT domain-containing protein [Streptomyces sp. G1]MCX5123940.1 VTT domain-containing protein [Streptomyces sp. NBC_00347]
MDINAIVTWLDVTSGLAGNLSGAACWAYAILALTTLPPLLPNNVLLVTSGVLAARGEMSIVLVVLSVAGSALLGDLLIHRCGRFLGDRARLGAVTRGRRGELFEWMSGQVRRRGIPFVVGVRFLPSGRLLGGLSAGAAGYPLGRFASGAALAELIWTAYSVGVGYFGGAISDDPVHSVALGLGLSLVVGVAASLAQRRTGRRAGRSAVRHTAGLALPVPSAAGNVSKEV